MAWDTREFRDIINEYGRLFHLSTDQKEKEKYLMFISNLKHETAVEELTRFERKNAKEEKMIVNDEEIIVDANDHGCFGMLVNDIYNVSKYELYYPFIQEFRDKLNTILKIKEYEFKVPGKLNVSRDDLLDIVEDVFKSTTKEIYDLYVRIGRNSINFDETRDYEDGESFYFPVVDKKFIEVGGKGNQEGAIWTIPHEAGHVIGHMINNNRNVKQDHFQEIEGHFFELISLDYLQDNVDYEYFNGLMKRRLFEYYNDSKKEVAFKKVIDNTFDNLPTTDDPYDYYEKLIKNEEDYGDFDVPDNINYVIGYIAAIELFEIYKQDKNLAFNLLKRIVSEDDTKTEYQRIVENVNMTEHVDEHVKRIGLHI